MTVYPNNIDSDLELPLSEDNVSEIRAETINSVRDATLAVENALGVKPQGNKSSLADRINISIDANGFIKSSALQNIGLVSLPIYDAEIAEDAEIKESKLNLDHTTSSLYSSIASSQSDISILQSSLATINNNINQHILGLNNYHDGYQIKISGTSGIIGGLSPTTHTIGAAVNEIAAHLFGGDETITPHFETDILTPFRHRASHILVDSDDFGTIINRSSTDVQSALENIETSPVVSGVLHTENFHSEGIFKEIFSGNSYNSQQLILSSNVITYISDYDGYGIVTFPNLSSFSGYTIKPGDILVISNGYEDSGSYQIRAIGPLNSTEVLGSLPYLDGNQLAIFHIFKETKIEINDVHAKIYKPSFISSDSCPLACAIRNNESVVDTISILHPHAARVKSIGFDGTVLATDGYHLGIRVGVGNGLFRTIDVPNLNLERLSPASANPVDARSVSERINAYVSDTSSNIHFPITAYRVGDELIIAHNWVGTEYTIEILDGYSGNFALGLDAYGADVVGKVITGNFGFNYSINGKSLEEIETLFDGYANISNSILGDTTFSLYTYGGQLINPLDYGIVQGSVLQISGHDIANSNGSYTVLTSTTTTVSIFSTEPILGPAVVDIKISASDVPLSILTNDLSPRSGLMQVYIDSNESVLLHQRLIYGNTLGSSVEIINVSSGFPIGETHIYLDIGTLTNSFYLISDTLTGNAVTLSKDFIGLFKLYHPNNLDYLTINIISGTIAGGLDSVIVSSPLPEDEALLLCTAYFNGEVRITRLTDNRLFGNISANNIREDLVELISQRPIGELHADGIIRGFDIIDAEFFDSMTNMLAVPLNGGVAYVSGVRLATQTQKVILQSYDSDGLPISATKIIGINKFGTIQEMDYDLGSLLLDGYETIFGRVLPLYVVTLTDGIIVDTTTDIIDIRRFINTIDNKIELVVDGYSGNSVGSFNTLEGALLYSQNYPSGEKMTIKIINTVAPTVPIIVPNGISIIGYSLYGGDKQQIVNIGLSGQTLLTLTGNNRLENVKVLGTSADLDGYLVLAGGSNINIEKCHLGFVAASDGYVDSNIHDIAINVHSSSAQNIRIVNNIIDTVYSGIVADSTIQNLLIDNNVINNVSGIGTEISCGIKLTCANYTDNASITISNNKIVVPENIDLSNDLRGIYVVLADGNDVDTIKISGNNISKGSMTNGIRVDAFDNGATGVINKLFIDGNILNGINYADTNTFGIGIKYEPDSNSNPLHAIANNVFVRDNVITSAGNNLDNNYGIYVTNGIKLAEVSNNIIRDCDLTRGLYIAPQDIYTSAYASVFNNNIIDIGSSAEYIDGYVSNSVISNNTLTGYGIVGITWSSSDCKISNNNIYGKNFKQIINVDGGGYLIDSNYLSNTINNNTIGICFDTVTADNISVIGNKFAGTMNFCVYSMAGIDNITINNNSAVIAPIVNSIYVSGATSGLVVGNNFVSGTGNIGSATPYANIGI